MVKYNLVLRPTVEGIRCLQPVGGWPRVRSYFIKLKCYNCGVATDFLKVTADHEIRLSPKRTVNLIAECENCKRIGLVAAQFSKDIDDEDNMCIMSLEADGLQPLNGAFMFDTQVVAIDLHGRTSMGFDVVVEQGHIRDKNGAPIAAIPVFKAGASYNRQVTLLQVVYERVH